MLHHIIELIIDTYWCGSGNVSRGLHELGPNYLVDACCRSHDLCNVFIEPGEEKYNVRNNGRFTISSCDCNDAFYRCLNTVNSYSSSAVLSAYASTYPDCLVVRPKVRCLSPANDYNKNPCKGYRNSENAADNKDLCSTFENRCEIYDVTDEYESVIVDSLFKTHQLELDQQKQQATIRPNDKDRSHQPPASPPSSSLFLPNVWQLVHGSP